MGSELLSGLASLISGSLLITPATTAGNWAEHDGTPEPVAWVDTIGCIRVATPS